MVTESDSVILCATPLRPSPDLTLQLLSLSEGVLGAWRDLEQGARGDTETLRWEETSGPVYSRVSLPSSPMTDLRMDASPQQHIAMSL